MESRAWVSADGDELVVSRAQADFIGVSDLKPPIRSGVEVGKVVVVRVLPLRKEAGGNLRSRVDGIGAGFIQSHRVERSEYPYIWDHRGVVFVVTIAVGRDLIHDADVKMRPPG